VPLDFTGHHRTGVGQEVTPQQRVESVDRLDQPHQRCLLQVLERLAAARVLARDPPRLFLPRPDQYICDGRRRRRCSRRGGRGRSGSGGAIGSGVTDESLNGAAGTTSTSSNNEDDEE